MIDGQITLQCALSDREIGLESMLALGSHWHLNGWAMPSFAAGHFVLLDVLDNAFFSDDTLTPFGVHEAAYVLYTGRDVVQPVNDHVSGVDKPTVWERQVTSWPAVTGRNVEAVALQLESLLEYARAGFEMIQSTGGDNTILSGHYDAYWLADIVSNVSKAWPGVTPAYVMWDMPMAMAGHCTACAARGAGENVERPVDYSAALEQLKHG